SRRCHLDISVDPVPKGIKEVEVWITGDSGKTWQMAGVSPQGKSPVTVELPDDGRFGYSFVVKPASGLMPTPPRAGDPPDGWLEIDTVSPEAELLGAVLGTGKDSGHLLLTWKASDANLGDKPISFFFALNPAGPWKLIADKLPNSGSHRWLVPKG